MTNRSVRRVALYARVSTRDHDQNPETQLQDLRELSSSRGWEIVGEHVDHASAGDFTQQTSWLGLLKNAMRHRFDAVLVWRLDRAFRDLLHGALDLQQLQAAGVGFVSMQEEFIDTTTPSGRFMFEITVAWAALERGVTRDRIRAGLRRARREGKWIGRPRFPVDVELVVRLRASGMTWAEISRAHPPVELNGRKRRPGRSTVRRAWLHRSGESEYQIDPLID